VTADRPFRLGWNMNSSESQLAISSADRPIGIRENARTHHCRGISSLYRRRGARGQRNAAEKYTNIASRRPAYRGGLPIARLHKVEEHVHAHLAESISIEALAELAELSPFHFSRVFKQATGMTPLQFVTRERMLHAQRLIRETSRSLIEIALEVGYTSPSHFAQVFRRTVGMAPTQFRNAL
jgi:AraC-like DNA-binding protein